MNAKGVNITKYMLGNTAVAKSTGIVAPIMNVAKLNTSVEVIKSSGGRIIAYLLAILVVIFVILLFINFFITPIFKLQPGGPGIIRIPGFDDGKLFWNTTTASQILNKDLPIAAKTFDYTMNMDVFIENPLQFSKHPRIFFSRGATKSEVPTTDTLLGILSNYNLVCALLPDTNDLIVSVLNKDNNMENIVISNIPVQEPFRLGIVIMEKAMEVYLNGKLMKTRTFLAPPMDTKGDIYPAAGIEANIVKVRNLKIWARLLASAEIREATPALSTVKDFGGSQMPTSTSCMAGTNTTDPTQKGMERLVRLSADTVPDPYSSLI